MIGSVQPRQLNISCHYFVFLFLFLFLFFSWSNLVGSVMTAEYFSSLFCFFNFFFFSLYLLYYAQDSCKNVTRNYRQAGSVQWRQLNISRHCFVFLISFSFLFIYYTTRRIVVKMWQEIIDKPGLFNGDSWIFLVTVLLFFSFSLSINYARDSSKKWQENKGKLGLCTRMNSSKDFLSLICFSLFCKLGLISTLSRMNSKERSRRKTT